MTIPTHAPETFNGARLLGNYESGTPEWHALRANSIGGSEIGTILGLNPWESPFYLHHLKTGELPPKQLDSFAAWLGTEIEPFIVGPLLNKLHPEFEVYKTGTYQHPTIPYLHANPDALAKVDGEWIIIEAKSSRNYWHQVPPAYVAQVQLYLRIMGLKRALIVGLVAMDPVEYWIEADEFEHSVIEQAAARFWDGVQAKRAPNYDGSESTYEAVREMHPDIDGTEVEIDGAHYLTLAQSKFDEAEAELRLAKSEVLAKMGTAQHCYVEHQGEKIRVASRQSRKGSRPFLIVHKAKG